MHSLFVVCAVVGNRVQVFDAQQLRQDIHAKLSDEPVQVLLHTKQQADACPASDKPAAADTRRGTTHPLQ
jgi:hypothetical protein